MKKIDICTHVLPPEYFQALTDAGVDTSKRIRVVPALSDIEMRVNAIRDFEGLSQVLSLMTPPAEELVSEDQVPKLVRICNDGLANLTRQYPKEFCAALACVPVINQKEMLRETRRAIEDLGMRGVQIFTDLKGLRPESEFYMPLYEMMEQYDLPVFIHPWITPAIEPVFGWPSLTSTAMVYLTAARIFQRYPKIKIVTHHCGGFVPPNAGRIWRLFFQNREWFDENRVDAEECFASLKMFYGDTAVYSADNGGIRCGLDFFGEDRILFGTDAPVGCTRDPHGHTACTIEAVDGLGLSEQTAEKIYHANAEKLLKL